MLGAGVGVGLGVFVAVGVSDGKGAPIEGDAEIDGVSLLDTELELVSDAVAVVEGTKDADKEGDEGAEEGVASLLAAISVGMRVGVPWDGGESVGASLPYCDTDADAGGVADRVALSGARSAESDGEAD